MISRPLKFEVKDLFTVQDLATASGIPYKDVVYLLRSQAIPKPTKRGKEYGYEINLFYLLLDCLKQVKEDLIEFDLTFKHSKKIIKNYLNKYNYILENNFFE